MTKWMLFALLLAATLPAMTALADPTPIIVDGKCVAYCKPD